MNKITKIKIKNCTKNPLYIAETKLDSDGTLYLTFIELSKPILSNNNKVQKINTNISPKYITFIEYKNKKWKIL